MEEVRAKAWCPARGGRKALANGLTDSWWQALHARGMDSTFLCTRLPASSRNNELMQPSALPEAPLRAAARPRRQDSGGRRPTAIASSRTARLLGLLGLLGVIVTVFLTSAGAAGEPSQYVPARSGGWPAWLAGPFAALHLSLGSGGFQTLTLIMCASYVLVLAFARTLPLAAIALAVIAAHVVLLLGPPLLSQDVFGYIGFARMGALHGLDPYTHVAAQASSDEVFAFLGWPYQHSPYGPLFTLLSYATVPLGVGGSLWAFKALAVLSSLGAVALVARAAGRLGHSRALGVRVRRLEPGAARARRRRCPQRHADRADARRCAAADCRRESALPCRRSRARDRRRREVDRRVGAAVPRARPAPSERAGAACCWRRWPASQCSAPSLCSASAATRSASWAPSESSSSSSPCTASPPRRRACSVSTARRAGGAICSLPCSSSCSSPRCGGPHAVPTGASRRAGQRSRCCSRPPGCCRGTRSGCCR